MRVAIIGAGALGRALARRPLASGHEVVFGGTTSAQEAAAELGVAYASNRAAAAAGEVVALAVPFAMIRAALEQAQPLDGVVLWSCVNALEDDLSGLAVGFDTTAAEEVAQLAPGARVGSAIPPVAESLNNGDLLYDPRADPERLRLRRRRAVEGTGQATRLRSRRTAGGRWPARGFAPDRSGDDAPRPAGVRRRLARHRPSPPRADAMTVLEANPASGGRTDRFWGQGGQ